MNDYKHITSIGYYDVDRYGIAKDKGLESQVNKEIRKTVQGGLAAKDDTVEQELREMIKESDDSIYEYIGKNSVFAKNEIDKVDIEPIQRKSWDELESIKIEIEYKRLEYLCKRKYSEYAEGDHQKRDIQKRLYKKALNENIEELEDRLKKINQSRLFLADQNKSKLHDLEFKWGKLVSKNQKIRKAIAGLE